MHDNTKEMIELLDQYPQYRNDIFKRGFLITNDTNISLKEYPFYDNWDIKKIHNFIFYLHKKQKLYIYDNGEKVFFLIGHAYNPFTMEIDEVSILKKISDNYKCSKKQYFNCINELTGIFTLGFFDNEKLQLLVDCAGLQGCYYGNINNKIFISSHMQLIGDICNLSRDPYIDELVNYKYYKLYGPYLPGDLSSYKEVKRLVPNTYVSYEKNMFKIKRFFPNEELLICNTKEKYDETIRQIGKIYHNNMELISKKWNNPAISMTGGTDSKVTVACANGLYDKFSYFSYISQYSEQIDAYAAHKIADKIGINHKIYNISDEDEEFENLDVIRKIITHNVGNIGALNDNDIRKRAYFKDIDEFDIEVKSWASEILRATYYKKYHKRKMPKHLSPRNITSMYKVFIGNRKLVKKTDEVFADYMNKIKFGENFSNYDESDMIYWELKYGGWGGLILTGEQKYSFDITLPFNNRILMTLFLSIPLEDRINDRAHKDVTRLMDSKLYDSGIHIVNYNKTKKRMYFEKMYFNINSLIPF